MLNERVSHNFALAKVLSILMVVVGHYFGSIFWIPTTVGLFIFAFSSGYFTSLKYHDSYSLRTYWSSKILRLVPSLFIINLFLLIIFIYQHKSGIFSWQSLISAMGLSGFLDWVGVKRVTPYGAGLWFFTLLIIFYVVYPLLDRLNRNHVMAGIMISALTGLVFYLHENHDPGYSIWLTALGFCFGVYTARFRLNMPSWFIFMCAVVFLVVMLVLNLFGGIRDFNFLLILLLSVTTVYFLLHSDLRVFPMGWILVLHGAIIEIYFIHYYLFLRGSGYGTAFDFAFSLSVILCVALVLSRLSSALRRAGPRMFP